MHTVVVILGVIVNIVLAVALLSIVVGLVWVISPLKNEVYMGGELYWYSTPLGGRGTGLVMLGSGFSGLILGFILDKRHAELARKFGSRT